ncbi:MAG TPA: hypothetical protein VFS46_08230 [Nitrososphaera sp.]|nr:hypothetical protein [Nitrososphaera sp.]
MKQLFIMAIAAGLLAVAPAQQSFAQYGSGPGTASQEQLLKCDELGIDRNQCNDSTILAKERLSYTRETTYGNSPEGSGTPYFQGIETLGVIGILGAVFGGIAGAFFLMGRRARQVPA